MSDRLLKFLSGWQDSNLRPPGPKPGTLTGLCYTPNKIYKLEIQSVDKNDSFVLLI